jgi:hypothetical protein
MIQIKRAEKYIPADIVKQVFRVLGTLESMVKNYEGLLNEIRQLRNDLCQRLPPLYVPSSLPKETLSPLSKLILEHTEKKNEG